MTPETSVRSQTRRGKAVAFLVCLAALVAQATIATAVDYYSSDPEGHRRAGRPTVVKALAAPSNTRNYDGYYLGGGSMFLAGGDRSPIEGTWGWDYGGLLKNTWVRLGWNSGNRYQGGTGSYRPEKKPFKLFGH
jgi:hypothetical protein